MADSENERSDFVQSAPELSEPIEVQDSRPLTSPYSTLPYSTLCAVQFQTSLPLYLAQAHLKKSRKLEELLQSEAHETSRVTTLSLPDISPGAGHVLVHFLCTGEYQCLRPQEEHPQDRFASELNTAVEVASVAELYGLPGLAELAGAELERAGNHLSVISMMNVVKTTSPIVQTVAQYVERRVESLLINGHMALLNEVLEQTETLTSFGPLVLRAAVKLRLADLKINDGQAKPPLTAIQLKTHATEADLDEPIEQTNGVSLAKGGLAVESSQTQDKPLKGATGGYGKPKRVSQANLDFVRGSHRISRSVPVKVVSASPAPIIRVSPDEEKAVLVAMSPDKQSITEDVVSATEETGDTRLDEHRASNMVPSTGKQS